MITHARVQKVGADSMGRRKRGTEIGAVKSWAAVRRLSHERYEEVLRARFQLGPDIDVLEFEPLVARLLVVMPEESPLDRYMHASVIAQQVLHSRKHPHGKFSNGKARSNLDGWSAGLAEGGNGSNASTR